MLVRRRQQQQQNTWKLLVVGLMNVLSVGVPLARDCAGDDYTSIWAPLGSVLEDILFPKKFVITQLLLHTYEKCFVLLFIPNSFVQLASSVLDVEKQ